jgi:tetratricopeptide (TPR) repeat protein
MIPDAPRGISGKVLVSGRPPANPIPVVIDCGKRHTDMALTDEKGRYSLSLDAIPKATPGDSARERLKGCYLTLRHAGFEPHREDLSNYATRTSFDPIRLKPLLPQSKGSNISSTGFEAPKQAHAEYAKGIQALANGRLAESAKHMEAAILSYTKYAAAYFVLGEVRSQMGDREAGRKAYEQAVTADPDFVLPRIRLAWIAVEDKDWKQAQLQAKTVMDLAPGQDPQMVQIAEAARNQEAGVVRR